MTDRVKQPTTLRAELSLPGAKAVGPSSPVHKFYHHPKISRLGAHTQYRTAASKSSGLLVGNHLFLLIDGCGLLNGSGLHWAAVTLLRPLEDALDCFAAVTMVKDAAERWSQRNLKPSDAARVGRNREVGSAGCVRPPFGALRLSPNAPYSG